MKALVGAFSVIIHHRRLIVYSTSIGVLVTRTMFGPDTMLALTPTIAYPPGHHHHQHHLRSLGTLQSYDTQTACSDLWAIDRMESNADNGYLRIIYHDHV